LSTVNQQYRTRYQTYSNSLANLSAATYIDSVLGSGTKSGYGFTYAGGTNTYTVSAVPTTAGTTGDRGFFVDVSGVVRFAASGAATSASSPID
jgi:hypothetical protein